MCLLHATLITVKHSFEDLHIYSFRILKIIKEWMLRMYQYVIYIIYPYNTWLYSTNHCITHQIFHGSHHLYHIWPSPSSIWLSNYFFPEYYHSYIHLCQIISFQNTTLFTIIILFTNITLRTISHVDDSFSEYSPWYNHVLQRLLFQNNVFGPSCHSFPILNTILGLTIHF